MPKRPDSNSSGSDFDVIELPLRERPRIFISYSHDSQKHKDWVLALAERLERDGVNVYLDQKDVRPSMLLSSFMERGVNFCDRILMIVTEPYLERSNNGVGGVGFEKSIIASEVLRDVETEKFIPILRSGGKIPSYLGSRLYIDARDRRNWEQQYHLLINEIYKNRPIKKPNRSREKIDLRRSKTSVPYHWSHHVHTHVGNKLYFIFLKFATRSIQPRESIISSLKAAGILDYHTFHLYAAHDLLVRVWASDPAVERLKREFANNADLDTKLTREYLRVTSVFHYPDGSEANEEPAGLRRLVSSLSASTIAAVQERRADTKIFNDLMANRLIVDDTVRFSDERIQFYIVIRALRHDHSIDRALQEFIKSYQSIMSKTIYITDGFASEAIIKGQVGKSDYYHINEFLENISVHLEHFDISTETYLVASSGLSGNGLIDTPKAERYLIECAFFDEVGDISNLPAAEEFHLKSRYAEAVSLKPDDDKGVLVELIKARARHHDKAYANVLVFMSNLEGYLRDNVAAFTAAAYKTEPGSHISRLMNATRAEVPPAGHQTLGVLLSFYSKAIEETSCVPISPLSMPEFKDVMQSTAKVRNRLAHNRFDPSDWDEIFETFCKFIVVHAKIARLLPKST